MHVFCEAWFVEGFVMMNQRIGLLSASPFSTFLLLNYMRQQNKVYYLGENACYHLVQNLLSS